MSRRGSIYATPEVARAARNAARERRRLEKQEAIAAKRHTQLLEEDRRAQAAADAAAHEMELDAPAELD